MARSVETIVTLTDDLDGSTAEQTVRFGFGGTEYEIDLSQKNAAALDQALAPYVASARRVTSRVRPATRTAGRARGRRTDLGQVREWARSNGYEVSARGRIPASVVAAYEAAQA